MAHMRSSLRWIGACSWAIGFGLLANASAVAVEQEAPVSASVVSRLSAQQALRAYREAERNAYDASSQGLFDNIAPDAVLVLNGTRTLHGREAVRRFFAPIWAANRTRIVELVDEEVTEAGSYIIVRGHFSLEITPRKGGKTTIEHGRYLSIFIRTADGGCQLWREATVDGA